MELCGHHRPKASTSSPSATRQIPSNYIFRLIKCGCLLIEIQAVCSVSVSIELELQLRLVLTYNVGYLQSRPAVLGTENWSNTAGMKQTCNWFRLCQFLLIKRLHSGWFWMAIIDLVTSHFLIYCLFDVVIFMCHALKL
jgi:hypothetical protein